LELNKINIAIAYVATLTHTGDLRLKKNLLFVSRRSKRFVNAFFQSVKSDQFQMFNFGAKENMKRYNQVRFMSFTK